MSVSAGRSSVSIDACLASSRRRSSSASSSPRARQHIDAELTVPRIDADELLPDWLSKELGRGNFGAVYSSEWRGAAVAVKKLHCSAFSEKDMRDFVGELNVLARLSHHPNVVGLIGASTDPSGPLLVLQLCELGSLWDVRKSGEPPLSFAQLVAIVRDVSAGLHHLHCEQVVHRDLAARNVLVDRALRGHVNDFGMSRVQQAMQSYGHTTQTVGAVRWMAPESIRRPGFYSFATDMWSFGCTVWEVMHVQQPYHDLAITDLIAAARDNNVPALPPLSSPPELATHDPSGVLAYIVSQCTQLDPPARLSSADCLALLSHLLSSMKC